MSASLKEVHHNAGCFIFIFPCTPTSGCKECTRINSCFCLFVVDDNDVDDDGGGDVDDDGGGDIDDDGGGDNDDDGGGDIDDDGGGDNDDDGGGDIDDYGGGDNDDDGGGDDDNEYHCYATIF